jgi:peptide/nickel transport system substrate-binding protein
MRTRRRLALLAVVALLVASCGGDDDGGAASSPTTTAPAAEQRSGGELTIGAEQFPECLNPVTACSNSSWMFWAVVEHVLPKLMELDPAGNYVPSPVLAGDPVLSGEGTDNGDGPFTVTYTIAEDAVWDDGTPITSADIEFTWQAILNTTGTLTTVGYDRIASVDTTDQKVAVVEFSEPLAAWADLFGSCCGVLLKADAFESDDIADELSRELPFSGGPFVLESFDDEGAVLARNEAYWDDDRRALLDRVNVVAMADQDTEINALLAGEVAAIYPQPAPGIADTLDGGETVDYRFGAGTQFEGLWFTQGSLHVADTPLNDPAVREALLFAVDRQGILDEVILPSFPETELLNCGGWVPTVGEWCDESDYADVSFDPERVASILEDAGWARGGDGIYAKDGRRLSMSWQTVAGNARRESIQALVIPQLAELGIEVVSDNSDADTLFQVRVPQLDTEIGLYAQVASPDPSVTTLFACENIPSEANEFSGQNGSGWCNEAATELMHEADRTPDPEERLELTRQIGDAIRADAVWLPFYQLPLITAWRTDLVAGPVGEYTESPLSGFWNLYDWTEAT